MIHYSFCNINFKTTDVQPYCLLSDSCIRYFFLLLMLNEYKSLNKLTNNNFIVPHKTAIRKRLIKLKIENPKIALAHNFNYKLH